MSIDMIVYYREYDNEWEQIYQEKIEYFKYKIMV